MENKTSTILVPIDFSDQSTIALEQSFNLARISESRIILLHVLRVSKSWLSIFSHEEQYDLRDKISKRLQNMAAEASARSGVPVQAMVRDGKLLESILNVSEEIKAHLIVVGTHPSSNFKQKLMGHNAYRLVKESRCPVLTIKGKHHKNTCESIILPLDLTKETREKVSNAIYYAKAFKAKIYTVSVITTDNKELVKKLNVQMQQVVKYISSQGVACAWNVIKVKNESEKIAERLLDYAQEKDADLIVIMTQQEMEITGYLIGSTAAEIIATSEIPVLSINPTFKYKYSPIM